MFYLKTIFITVALLVLAGCGADSKEKIASDAVGVMEEMVTILESVKDKASAEAAKPKLEALAKKKDSFDARLEALNLKKEEIEKFLKEDEALKKRAEAAGKKIMSVMMKAMQDKDVQGILGEAMKKMN